MAAVSERETRVVVSCLGSARERGPDLGSLGAFTIVCGMAVDVLHSLRNGNASERLRERTTSDTDAREATPDVAPEATTTIVVSVVSLSADSYRQCIDGRSFVHEDYLYFSCYSVESLDSSTSHFVSAGVIRQFFHSLY